MRRRRTMHLRLVPRRSASSLPTLALTAFLLILAFVRIRIHVTERWSDR